MQFCEYCSNAENLAQLAFTLSEHQVKSSGKMSKNKKPNRVLDRNSTVAKKTVDKTTNSRKVHFSEVVSETPPVFTAPEFCTLLQLADEMKTVRNAKSSSRSLPQPPRSKNLNFLPDEKIYQDLVDLAVSDGESVSEIRSQPCIKLRKDPEVDVNKYTKHSLQPEYFFTSHFAPDVKNQKTVFDGHSIYQNFVAWAEYTH